MYSARDVSFKSEKDPLATKRIQFRERGAVLLTLFHSPVTKLRQKGVVRRGHLSRANECTSSFCRSDAGGGRVEIRLTGFHFRDASGKIGKTAKVMHT